MRGSRVSLPSQRSTREFQLGPFWLGRESMSANYYVYWYDPKLRKTRRRSTHLSELEKAKLYLARLALLEAPRNPLEHKDVALETIRHFYIKQHASKIRSTALAERAFELVADYFKEKLGQDQPALASFSVSRQEEFMRWCRDRHSLKAKSIATYLTYIKAASRYAATPRMLQGIGGDEVESQIIDKAPHIISNEADVARVTGLQRSSPRQWVPTDDELAAILSNIKDEHVFRYAILALNTWARPEAINELSVLHQVDFDRALVYLNPPGRPQSNKVRPTIKLTKNLRGWLLFWNLDRPIVFNGKPIAGISNRTLQKIAARAQLSKPTLFNRYCLRHYMATRVRRVPGIFVPREERAAWMGHVDPHHRTTEAWYESLDPEHLQAAANATDRILETLDSKCSRSLFAPRTVGRLQILGVSSV